MKAYGHHAEAPIPLLEFPTWAAQSKHNTSGPRFNRKQSRRPWKRRARRLAKIEIKDQLHEYFMEQSIPDWNPEVFMYV